jgi:hypothetical protein
MVGMRIKKNNKLATTGSSIVSINIKRPNQINKRISKSR